MSGVGGAQYHALELERSGLTEENANRLAALYGVPVAWLLALDGSIPDKVQAYLRATPEAGLFLARWADLNVSPKRIAKFAERFNRPSALRRRRPGGPGAGPQHSA